MRGNSNKKFILKRADGRWKSAFEACESLLEQGMERLLRSVSTFGSKPLIFFEVDRLYLSTRVVTRVTLVPVF
jgi:hypothetical protein